MLQVWFDVFCVFFALMLSVQGQSVVIGPIQPIVAAVGDDIILPCYLNPAVDASDMTVEWTRPDLETRLVHVWPERAELQNPSYKGRTSLLINELQHGNISLKISKVKVSDEGTYRCFVPDLRRDTAVRLVVGAASSPVAQINRTSSRVVLQCESAGWYPEPELLWLDGERNLLPAGPTETLRGPDDLYTVSSRVTVEEKHGNNITCRVQQKSINQHRETHIHVSDDFFMVISPSSPPSDPSIDPNTIIGLVIGAVVVVLILAVSCVVWKLRQTKHRNKKKSEEDGPEQTRKEDTIESKNDNCGFHVVVEEGESEPLVAGREEEDDVDSRGEQRHKDEGETKQDEFVLETEQTKDNPQEKRINPSVVIDKESLTTIETETQEDVTGREEEDDVDSRGEKKFKEERETQQDEQRRDANRPETNTSAMTEKEPQIKEKEETHEEQIMTGRKETDNVDSRGGRSNKDERRTADHHVAEAELKAGWRRSEEEMMNQFILTEKVSQSTREETHEEQERRGRGMKAEEGEGGREKKMEGGKVYSGLPEAKSFNFTFHLNTDQEPWRGKEKQQEQLVEERQRESDVIRKKSDTKKARSEENRSEVLKAEKKRRVDQREKLLAERREKNQKKQSENREREKDETELQRRKSKNQHHKEGKTQERREEESEHENHGEGNQTESLGMTGRKTEEQRGQEESLNSSVSSKVTLNTDLKIPDKRRQNQEKQPENKSQQSREEIREQPEKQRRAQSEEDQREEDQSEMIKPNEGVIAEGPNRKERENLQLTHEGALQAEQQVNISQKEEPEESVSLTERGVDCLEKPQEEKLLEVDEAPDADADQQNINKRKPVQEVQQHDGCNLPAKRQKIQEGGRARKHQNVRKGKQFLKKENVDHMEVDDAAHSQHAAITQQHETIKWPNELQMLSEQKEPQGYLTEHDEDLMEVEEHSGH